MTLQQARNLQKQEEKRVILKLIISAVIIGVASFLLFCYTDILQRSSLYYLIPFAALLVAVKYTGFATLFTAKEFTGTVIKNEIYNADERKVKRGGFHALQDRFMESEIIVKNEQGKTLIRVYRNGDITNKLIEGDKIAILRFVPEPVVIESKSIKTPK